MPIIFIEREEEVIRALHLASFNGNIGDIANHVGFWNLFKKYVTNDVEVTYLEIREYYKSWNLRQFDDSFADLVNRYDLLVIGGGNFFDVKWDYSTTGTTLNISDEILKWQLTFTDDFYREIYRLWKLPFIPKYIKNKPSFIGKLTSKYIYEQLPKGVVDRIKEKTGKTEKGNWKYKWHQALTPEIGREHLKKQIIEVTTLMSISQAKEQFDSLFQQKYNTTPVQLQLEFNEEIKNDSPNDDFDKSIDKILGFKED